MKKVLSRLVKSRKTRKVVYNCWRSIFRKEMWGAYVQYSDGNCIRLNMGKHQWHQDYCADPFLFVPSVNGERYLFYETLDNKDKGIIGCFKEVGGDWQQLGKVLECDYHISYPQVFEDNGDIYMIPESCANGTVDLFRAKEFPMCWEKIKTLISLPSVDSTLLHTEEGYFLFCHVGMPGQKGYSELWWAKSLMDKWRRHPQCRNINQSRRLARNGGCCLREGGRIYRVVQDCCGAYGKRVFRIPILKITKELYEEGKAQLLLNGKTSEYHGGRHTYNVQPSAHLVAFDVQEWRIRPIKEVMGRITHLLLLFCKKIVRQVYIKD